MGRLAALYHRPLWQRLLIAPVTVSLGLALRDVVFDALGAHVAYVTFYPAVELAAVLGGWAPGMLAMALSVLIVLVHFIPLAEFGDAMGLAIFSVSCAGICVLGDALRRSHIAAQAARALIADSRERQALVAGALGAWEHDIVADVVSVNQTYREMFGLSAHVIVRQRLIYALMPPEDAARVDAAVRRSLAPDGDGRCLADYRIRRVSDGATRWISMSAQTFFEGRRPTLVVGVCRDTTEERATREALLETAQLVERMTNVAASAPGVTFSYRIGADGRRSFPYASPNTMEMLGVDATDIASQAAPFHEKIRADDRARVDRAMSASADSMSLLEIAFRYEHPQKKEIWLEVKATPIRQDDGAVVWHGFAADVTKARRSQEALIKSESEMRTIVETAFDGIIAFDKSGVVQTANSACVAMFGYSSDKEIIGKKVMALMPGSHCEAHADLATDVAWSADSQSVGVGDTFGLRRDGGIFAVDLRVHRVMIAGESPTYVGFIRDLTQQRRNEVRIEKLHLERLAAMARMSTALAHEVNQPMTALSAYVDVARRLLERAPNVDKIVLDTLDKAREQTRHATRILKSHRRFVAQGEPDKAMLAINDLVREACEPIAVRARAAGVDVSLSLDANAGMALADRHQIKEVLSCMMRNAMDAMRSVEKKQLIVSTKRVFDAVQCDIADTGSRIDENQVSCVLDGFATSEREAAGVGVMVARSIVEAHYGTMWGAPNMNGCGMVFSFTLPSATQEDEECLRHGE